MYEYMYAKNVCFQFVEIILSVCMYVCMYEYMYGKNVCMYVGMYV